VASLEPAAAPAGDEGASPDDFLPIQRMLCSL